jgi:hypothetical protein
MHGRHEGPESPKSGPKQLHHLKDLVQQGDAEAFANELNLDPRRTREWFDRGLTTEGYGAEVIKAIGTLVLTRILTTIHDREKHVHG